MQEALELKSQGIDIVDLGPGEPDFPTPAAIKQVGIDAIASDFTKYTPASGIKELRDAIAEEFNRKWGTDFSGSNVMNSSSFSSSVSGSLSHSSWTFTPSSPARACLTRLGQSDQ